MIDFESLFVEEFRKTLPVLAHRQKVFQSIYEQFEKQLYQYALQCSLGNVKKAATYLNVNRNTVRKRCLKYGLDPKSMQLKTS